MSRRAGFRSLVSGRKGKLALLIAAVIMAATLGLSVVLVRIAPEWVVLALAITTLWKTLTDWLIAAGERWQSR